MLFNHLPILGTLFGILILITGMVLGNNPVKRTALGLFILSAGFAAVAFFSGEGAEEAVEGMAGVSEALIGRHEQLADLFFASSGVVGALAMLTFLADLRSWKVTRALYALVLAGSIGSMVLGQQTGTSGGEIRHSEIRAGVAQNDALLNTGEAGGERSENEETED